MDRFVTHGGRMKENGGKEPAADFHVIIHGHRVEKYRKLREYLLKSGLLADRSLRAIFDYMLDMAWIGMQDVLKDKELQDAIVAVDRAQERVKQIQAERIALAGVRLESGEEGKED